MKLVRVAAVTPKVNIGDVDGNINNIIELLYTNKDSDIVDKIKKCDIIVTPELSLTGYTCQDMFFNKHIIDKFTHLEETLHELIEHIARNQILIVGAPLITPDGKLTNCAIVLNSSGVQGIVPKTYIPNYSEFYEKRWFTPKYNELKPTIFEFNGIKFGVEICEDLWSPNPPSVGLTMYGAEIIFNLSASNEVIGKAEYRRRLVEQQSARCICGYVYASAGLSESTSDIVFSGHNIIAENGTILTESELFNMDANINIMDIDVDRIRHDRLLNKTFADSNESIENCYYVKRIHSTYKEGLKNKAKEIEMVLDTPRKIKIEPFVPYHNKKERCKDIFNIQVAGLAQRWNTTQSQKLVIGVSGGLDSTLALLVCCGAADKLGFDRSRILGITMPAFGTSENTLKNSLTLMEELGVSSKKVDITASVKQHLQDMGLSEDDRSVAYENAQARERTQLLMDIANMVGGFVVGTGDLSELALGWCTYNGDHMSMYNVNGSIPKTLVKMLVEVIGESMAETSVKNYKLKEVIKSICNTPISPELLPPDDKGRIQQLTENTVGPYVLNDFFLYYTMRYGECPVGLFKLTCTALNNELRYNFSMREVLHWLRNFYTRFARAQFKRNCCPDGVKVGSVSLNPRGDWRMPSEFNMSSFMNDLNVLEGMLNDLDNTWDNISNKPINKLV